MTSSAAQQLWNARISDTKLASNFCSDLNSEVAAYKLQSELISLSGLPVIGWKIGATNETLFDVLGVTQPFFGPLFDRFTYASGEDLKILPGHNLETEFTVRLKTDLPFREESYTHAEIGTSISSIIPSFEIVGARFEGELAGAGYRLIADGGANIATVLGSEIGEWRGFDLTDYPVSLSLNGKSVCEGSTSALLWDHVFDALAWLVRQPAISERGLLADDIVMTGTCTGITPLSQGDRVVADFGEMGEVRAAFV